MIHGCEFDSSTCHNKSAIGKEGNGKPPHKVHSQKKFRALSLVSATLKIGYATQHLKRETLTLIATAQEEVLRNNFIKAKIDKT